MTLDKKSKKRIAVLRERLQKLEKMLAGAKQQCDDPDEVKELEDAISRARDELAKLGT